MTGGVPGRNRTCNLPLGGESYIHLTTGTRKAFHYIVMTTPARRPALLCKEKKPDYSSLMLPFFTTSCAQSYCSWISLANSAGGVPDVSAPCFFHGWTTRRSLGV